MPPQENQRIIEVIVPPPELSPEEKARTFELFQDNLDLIFRYADIIIHTPQLYHCPLDEASIELAYVGEYQPPLGALVRLWQDGTLVEKCEHCQGDLCLYRASVAPLSGANQCTGICRSCRTISTQTLTSFIPVMTALKYIRANLNKRKVLRTQAPPADSSPEAAASSVPDEVIAKEIIPVNLNVLVRRLRKYADKEAAATEEQEQSFLNQNLQQ